MQPVGHSCQRQPTSADRILVVLCAQSKLQLRHALALLLNEVLPLLRLAQVLHLAQLQQEQQQWAATQQRVDTGPTHAAVQTLLAALQAAAAQVPAAAPRAEAAGGGSSCSLGAVGQGTGQELLAALLHAALQRGQQERGQQSQR